MTILSTYHHPNYTSTWLSTGLGSSASTRLSNLWITDGSGQAIQHLHYLPFGEDWVDQRNASWNAPYTFSGKEKDIETGYGYFGARYYDSGLSIWLSVDPMSDKYPSMSPYNYCANNPVILVDPDGRDYETVIDEIAWTITIKAVYYTKNSNRERLKDAISVWNGQSGKYEVVVGEGDNKKKYTVNFELTIADGDFKTDTEASAAIPNQRKNSNFFEVDDNMDSDHIGESGGVNAHVRPDGLFRTDVHEIAHTLGVGEGTNGVMLQGGFSEKIRKEHVMSILDHSGANLSGSTWGSCEKSEVAKTINIDLSGKFKRKWKE